MKRNEEMRQAKNRGMSLIELLIAVCILVIVVAPLLHAFYSSALTNRKSKIKLEATTVAENQMEQIKALSVPALEQIAKNQKSDAVKADGSFSFNQMSVQNNSRKYDVYVTLNPGVYQSGSTTKFNSTPVMEDLDFSDKTNAFYVQPTDMDARISEESYPGVYWNFTSAVPDAARNKETIAKNMQREIRLTVQTENGCPTVYVTITYYYSVAGIADPFVSQPIKDQQIYQAANGTVKLHNIYLFYEPLYNLYSTTAATPEYDETIVIENKELIPVKVHLMKQNKKQMTDSGQPNTDDEDPNYKIDVKVIEPSRTYTPNYYVTQLRSYLKETQMRITFNDGSSDFTGDATLQEKKEDGTLVGTTTSVPISDLLNVKPLMTTKAQNLIYAVEVKVFNEGEKAENGDKELVSITGTKEK